MTVADPGQSSIYDRVTTLAGDSKGERDLLESGHRDKFAG